MGGGNPPTAVLFTASAVCQSGYNWVCSGARSEDVHRSERVSEMIFRRYLQQDLQQHEKMKCALHMQSSICLYVQEVSLNTLYDMI